MVPLRDVNPRQTTPYVNYVLVGLNLFVWFWQLSAAEPGTLWLSAAYGLVPVRFLADPIGEAFTILTSMFMHGGWAHLGGNLLFLFVFGDNVEDALGHKRYASFYLASGVAAAFAQIAYDTTSTIPMVGASGAIAGALGGYLVLYPRAPVMVFNPILPLWFFIGVFPVFPAALVVGEWFLWNLLGGFGSLGQGASGGTAFFAHLGGFLAGLLLVRPMMRGRSHRDSRRWEGWRDPPRPPTGGGGGWQSRGGGSWRSPRGRGRSPWY